VLRTSRASYILSRESIEETAGHYKRPAVILLRQITAM